MTINKKLYLVNPPDKGMLSGFPGALLFLKAWVRLNMLDVDVQYVDLALSKKTHRPVDGTIDAVAAELEEYDLVEDSLYGITATTATYQNALRTAQVIKKRRPDAKIILGGHHAMHQSENILQLHREIDYCALGEGERTIVDLLEGKSIDKVRGIAYRDSTSGFILKNPTSFLTREELDRFTFASFDWTPFSKILDDKLRGQFGYFDINTARGCNLKCTFCTFGDDKLRDMSPDAKAQLFSDIVSSDFYKSAIGLNIHDNDFAQNQRKTHELCDIIIGNGLKFRWTVQTRVEHCNAHNKDLVEKLARAGCVEVYFGVENFDPAMAKYLKHVSDAERYLQHTQEAVINTLTYGIGCNINLQLGIPGETEETRKNNIQALRRIVEAAERIEHKQESPVQVVVYPQLSVVYPGTAMAYLPVNGTDIGLPTNAFELFTQWEWEQEQRGFVEYLGEKFAHGNGGIPLGLVDVEQLIHNNSVVIIPEKLRIVNEYLDQMNALSKEHPVLTIFDYSCHIQK